MVTDPPDFSRDDTYAEEMEMDVHDADYLRGPIPKEMYVPAVY